MQNILNDALDYARKYVHEGNVATYIPELKKANPNHLGVCLITSDNSIHHAGEYLHEFTIQSISKTLSLILALEIAGYEQVFSRVGVEPTGDAFNSLVKLETRDIRPLNPMINAGAIATVSCFATKENAFELFMERACTLLGRNDIKINENVYQSEKKSGMRNRAMAYMMQSENVFYQNAEEVIDLYFKICSVNVNTKDLAYYANILANNGVDNLTNKRVLDAKIATIIKTLMMTCGMYDSSGDFALNVGIPAKSGVGGGIMCSVEKKMGLAVYGPALDKRGNSVGGYRILEYLSKELNLHYFA